MHEAPGKDPLKVYEVSGVINKRDRIFKRKNRIDVVCIGAGILSLSAPTKEVKAQFLEKLEASCEPGNSNLMRQLRADMAAESRKVIALATLSDEWKAKYERLVEERSDAASEEATAVMTLVLERFANLLGRKGGGLVGRGFEVLKQNVAALQAETDRMEAERRILEEKRAMEIKAALTSAVKKWLSKTRTHYFIRWVKFTVGDHVRGDERITTLQNAKKQLGSSVALVLDIMGPARRQEISLMEAELDALDSEAALSRFEDDEKAGSAAEEVEKKMIDAISESYARAMNECDSLGAPITPGKEGSESFVGARGELSTPNIHIFSDDDDDDDDEEEQDEQEKDEKEDEHDANLSWVPSQVKKIERRLSQTPNKSGSFYKGN